MRKLIVILVLFGLVGCKAPTPTPTHSPTPPAPTVLANPDFPLEVLPPLPTVGVPLLSLRPNVILTVPTNVAKKTNIDFVFTNANSPSQFLIISNCILSSTNLVGPWVPFLWIRAHGGLTYVSVKISPQFKDKFFMLGAPQYFINYKTNSAPW